MTKNRYEVESVRRGLDLLRVLVEQGSLSLEQAIKITDTAKSTAFRLLETLQGAGLVERTPIGGYVLGPEALRWAFLLIGRLDGPAVASEDLQSLCLDTKETVGFAMMTSKTIILAEIFESPAPFRMAEVPGTVVCPHASAVGKAILAHIPQLEREAFLGEEPYQQITPNSLTTLSEFDLGLEKVYKEGYAIEIEESILGVACVAAPVFRLGNIFGGISIAGPRIRMTDERLAQLGAKVAETAKHVSQRLSPVANNVSYRPV